MYSNIHDLSTNNSLYKEFRNRSYNIIIYYNILTLLIGYLVYIKKAGTEHVMRLKEFRNISSTNLTLLFNNRSLKELLKDRLLFTSKAGL
jgi:hypothetical protein